MSQRSSRLKEALGLFMVGDGVLCLLFPEKHLELWKIGPDPLKESADELSERKTITRILGAVGVAAGIWLASRQYDFAD